jgi:hypothetical protein
MVSKGQGKLLTKICSRYIFFWAYLGFLKLTLVGIETWDSKLKNYLNIFLSFYRNIVRENVECG